MPEKSVRSDKVPMSSDVERVLQESGRAGSRLWAIAGLVLGVAAVLLALFGGIATMIAVPVGVIALTFLGTAWSVKARSAEDVEWGTIIRATGMVTLSDKTTTAQQSFGSLLSSRRCQLIVGEVKLSVSGLVADAIRSAVQVASVKKKTNLLTDTFGDEIDFAGIVEYAPRSSTLLSVRTEHGRLVWLDPGLASGTSASAI